MDETLALYKCILFLLSLQILFTEGRPIKLMNMHLHQSKSTNNVQAPMTHWSSDTAVISVVKGSRFRAPIGMKFTKKNNFQESTVASKDNFRSATPAGQKEKVPVTSYSVDDFRPTSPDFSLGVDHPKQIVTSTSVEHYITGVKTVGPTKSVTVSISNSSTIDDFRPTSPDFSLGVGHPKQIVTRTSIDHSITGFKAVGPTNPVAVPISSSNTTDDFQPTSPGFSFGVGHPKQIVTSTSVDHSVTGVKTVGPTKFVAVPISSSSTIDDFQPTSPTFSSGIGHPKQIVTSTSVEHSVTRVKAVGPTKPIAVLISSSSTIDDFRPISPGFSPGVSHSKQIVTNTSVEHFVTGVKAVGLTKPVAVPISSSSIIDDFRPTSPSFSFGIGHPKQIIISTSVEHYATRVKAVDPTKPVAVPISSSSTIDDFRPTAPGFSPGVGHPKQIITSSSVDHSISGVKAVGHTKSVPVGHSSTEVGRTINVHQSKSIGSGATASAKDDFRPTAPGYSPGVGHPKKPAVIDDFRPTAPGYSPGVGHPKKPAVVTSSNVVEHSVTGFKDDFRPTQPGHSPGVGHKNSVEPNP